MHAGGARAIARAHLRARMPTRRTDRVASESSTVSSDTMRADRRHAHCPKARSATRIAMGEMHASGGARAPARGFRGRRGPVRYRCSRQPPASDARCTGASHHAQRSSILGIRVARCKEKARVAAEHGGCSLKACDARPRRVQPVRRAVARALAAESRGRRASGSGIEPHQSIGWTIAGCEAAALDFSRDPRRVEGLMKSLGVPPTLDCSGPHPQLFRGPPTHPQLFRSRPTP